jgi:hypothetical protein
MIEKKKAERELTIETAAKMSLEVAARCRPTEDRCRQVESALAKLIPDGFVPCVTIDTDPRRYSLSVSMLGAEILKVTSPPCDDPNEKLDEKKLDDVQKLLN